MRRGTGRKTILKGKENEENTGSNDGGGGDGGIRCDAGDYGRDGATAVSVEREG